MNLVSSAGLVDTLSGPGPFVVLAPTNAAFGRLPPAVIQMLSNPVNLAMLQKVLKYHVIAGQLPSDGLRDRQQFVTVAGENVTVFFTSDRLLRTVNYAEVISFQAVRCQNGVIFLLDNVLFPSGLAPVLPPSQPYTPTSNIVSTLQSDSRDRFSTLGSD